MNPATQAPAASPPRIRAALQLSLRTEAFSYRRRALTASSSPCSPSSLTRRPSLRKRTHFFSDKSIRTKHLDRNRKVVTTLAPTAPGATPPRPRAALQSSMRTEASHARPRALSSSSCSLASLTRRPLLRKRTHFFRYKSISSNHLRGSRKVVTNPAPPAPSASPPRSRTARQPSPMTDATHSKPRALTASSSSCSPSSLTRRPSMR
jgi:hypothetical protein